MKRTLRLPALILSSSLALTGATIAEPTIASAQDDAFKEAAKQEREKRLQREEEQRRKEKQE